MRPNLINRLKEEWNNLDPVDPLRGLIADAIDALAEKPAQPSKPWVALTDWEREKLRSEADEADAGYTQLIKATEAKLREKNA